MMTFNERQSQYNVATGDLATYEGNCFLGIDAGSTTTKAALVGEDGSLLYSFYEQQQRKSPGNHHPCRTGNLFPDCRILPGSLTPVPPVTVKH